MRSVWYLVERYLPTLGHEQVAGAVGRLGALDGRGVYHMWTVLIPDEDTCISLFRAVSSMDVARANDEAGFAFTRIIPAVAFATQRKDLP